MAEINEKRLEKTNQSLKKADSLKSHEGQVHTSAFKTEVFGRKKYSGNDADPRVKVKKKMPIAVDIIAGITMLIIVFGVIVGTYMLFRYYSNDYESTDITYTVEIPGGKQDVAKYIPMKNKEVFMDKDSNAVYFGKITSVETSKETENIRFTISATAKYRRGEGYSIGDTRIAVGSNFKLRCGETSEDVNVVGLKGGK